MRRDTKVIYGSIIVLTTIVVVGGFFAVLQFQYARTISNTNQTVAPVEDNAEITSEVVVVHQAVPVAVDRFGLTLELTTHKKINDTAITSEVTITTVETPTPTVLQFTGIGESQTTADNYIVRIVNATESSAQILVGK